MSLEAGVPRRLFIAGLVLVGLGVTLFLWFVAPHIVFNQFSPGTPSSGPTRGSIGLALAVLGAATGLAAGSALVGIGLGHWRRPLPSRVDGSPEV